MGDLTLDPEQNPLPCEPPKSWGLLTHQGLAMGWGPSQTRASPAPPHISQRQSRALSVGVMVSLLLDPVVQQEETMVTSDT